MSSTAGLSRCDKKSACTCAVQCLHVSPSYQCVFCQFYCLTLSLWQPCSKCCYENKCTEIHSDFIQSQTLESLHDSFLPIHHQSWDVFISWLFITLMSVCTSSCPEFSFHTLHRCLSNSKGTSTLFTS